MTDCLPARCLPACYHGERTMIDPAWADGPADPGIDADFCHQDLQGRNLLLAIDAGLSGLLAIDAGLSG